MPGYVLGLYSGFACLAGRCPSTCCSGWKIIVDPEAYERFRNLTDTGLRQDILDHIYTVGGTYCFRNQGNGNCSMLDPDGLCRIQRNTDEQMLCNTCRKFPRLMAKIGNHHWVSFAASCPVVAEYVLGGKPGWLYLSEDGKMKGLEERKILSAAGMEKEEQAKLLAAALPEQEQKAAGGEALCRKRSLPECFEQYVDFAMDALDVLLKYKELPYLENSFDLYDREKVDPARFQSFFELYALPWRRFVHQYFVYRYPSRYLEYQDEAEQERLWQVMGELVLMRIMLCSRYYMMGELKFSDWSEVLSWTYRFCAHGERMAEQNHQNFMKNCSLLNELLFD